MSLASAIARTLTAPALPTVRLWLPAEYAEALLAKGAGHKYIKRVPKAGGGYRYYYEVGHGGGVHNEDHFVVGASFRHGNGHFHLTHEVGDKRYGDFRIRHDETGEEREVTRGELQSMMMEEHAKAIQAHRERIRADWADAHRYGASDKQKARIRERAKGWTALQSHMPGPDPKPKASSASLPDPTAAHADAKARQTRAHAEHRRLSREFDRLPHGKRTAAMSASLEAARQERDAADEAEAEAYRRAKPAYDAERPHSASAPRAFAAGDRAIVTVPPGHPETGRWASPGFQREAEVRGTHGDSVVVLMDGMERHVPKTWVQPKPTSAEESSALVSGLAGALAGRASTDAFLEQLGGPNAARARAYFAGKLTMEAEQRANGARPMAVGGEHVDALIAELRRRRATTAKGTWAEVDPEVGARRWRVGLADGDVATLSKSDFRIEFLAKARTGHKYIKRVATGNPRRPWRYFYNDAAVAHDAQAGERLNTKTGGKLDVVKVEDGKVHVRDEAGQHHALEAHELHERMFAAHTEAAERLATKAAAEWAKARGTATGTPAEHLHAALKSAGLGHVAAVSLARFVESRPGWSDAARRTLADAVSHSGRKPRTVADNLRQIVSGAENLRTARRAKQVTPAHVAEAVEKRLPKGKDDDGFPEAWTTLRGRLEKANAKAEGIITALEHIGPDSAATKALAEQAQAALAGEAHHEARAMAHTFPGLRGDAVLGDADALAARLTAVLARAKAPTTVGASTTVYIANKDGRPEPRQARYRVVEADDVHASHLPDRGFEVNPAYPTDVQERQYHSDKAEQEKVRGNADKFRPDIVHNTNPDAVNGAPLITEDGVVLGGNSRTMTMQLLHGSGKGQSLKDHLAENAYQFGLTREAVEGLKNPILVRELVGVDAKSTPKAELRDLVRRANESFTQGMDPRTAQVALARRVNDDILEKLGAMGPDETLNDFLSKPSRSTRDFVGSLQNAGIIDRRNRSQYLRDDGMLNQDGRQFVERLLVGRMIPDPDLLGDIAPSTMGSVARAAPHILGAANNGASHDLTHDLRVALRTQADMAQHGHKTLEEHLAQGLFDFGGEGRRVERPIEGNDRAKVLHEIIAKHGGPAVMSRIFREYARRTAGAHDAQGGLFGGGPTSTEVLRSVVKSHGAAATQKGASVYVGPRGGKWADPEHHRHWTPAEGGGEQSDWVGAEHAEKRVARKQRVDRAMTAWKSAAARLRSAPTDRRAFQAHFDALHELGTALNLPAKNGERAADAAASWLESAGHTVPRARSSTSAPAAEQQSLFRGRRFANAVARLINARFTLARGA